MSQSYPRGQTYDYAQLEDSNPYAPRRHDDQDDQQEYLRASPADASSTADMYRTASASSSNSEQHMIATGGRAYPAHAHYSMHEVYPPQRSLSTASTAQATMGQQSVMSHESHASHKGKAHEFGPDYPEGWTQEDMEAEKEFLKSGMINWNDMFNWRFWIRAKWWYYYLALIILIVVVILVTIYHDQIITWCTPAANWMKDLPGGWAIPIGILFVISFPPLFGHEIVAMICGLVWGLWIGFGIVCAGTFLGEVGNYYAFKYCCRSRAEKYERKNMAYACLAYTMREGSLWIIIAARLSAIPGHLTTAVFSTCGMNIWIFMLGAFLTLPKQLITVYLGVIFKGEKKSKTDQIISYTVLVVGLLITVGAAWWIWYEMHKVRVLVWRKRRMEMASRGISLGTVGTYNKEQFDIEAASPMLAVDPAHAGHDHSPHHPRHLRNSIHHPAHPYSPGPPHTSAPLRDMRASYQTPYDISYKRTNDDMSIYNVDAMNERMQMEQDIADRLQSPRASRMNPAGATATAGPAGSAGPAGTTEHLESPPHSPTEARRFQKDYVEHGLPPAFPQAQASGLRRDPSSASAFYRPGQEPGEAVPSSFPTATPYYGGVV